MTRTNINIPAAPAATAEPPTGQQAAPSGPVIPPEPANRAAGTPSTTETPMVTRRQFLAASPALFALPSMMARQCGGDDWAADVAEVVGTARDVVNAFKSTLPAGSEWLARAERWLVAAEGFQRSFAEAVDDVSRAKLLPTLSALVSAFQTDIMPVLDVRPEVRVAVALADAALRVVARRFQRAAEKAMRQKGTSEAATRAGVEVDASLKTISEYLAQPEVEKK